jgi:serine O-acetyltransferase
MARRIADLERQLATLRGEDPGQVAEVVPFRSARGPSPAGG